MKRKFVFIVLAVGLLLAACMPSQQQIDQIVSSVEQTAIAQVTVVAPTADVNAIVQATFQALTAQAVTPTPAGSTGSISGSLNYPSSFIPALRIVVYLTGTSQYFYVDTVQNQNSYQIDNLPVGIYHVVAYTGLSAGYTQAVPCGLSVNCVDHSLIDVNVNAGQVTGNVNPFDWYAPQGAFPPLPDAIALPNGGTDNIPTNTPPGGQVGSIAGTLSYPAEGLPAMAIVAYRVGGGQNDYYYVLTIQGQNTYQIDNLPVGTYHIVTYTMGGGGFPAGLPGGYSQYVVCGMQPACTDHTLVNVQVNASQITGNINPQDWYAPDGTFPTDPIP